MTRQLSRQNPAGDEPFYGKIWSNLKRFPNGLAEGAKTAPSVSGPAAAAVISAAIGCFTMMVSESPFRGHIQRDKRNALEPR